MKQSVGKRIIVVGSSNAGKSTLGRALAERLGVPFIELDALHWEADWVPAEREVFRERVRKAIEAEAWVLDGNYTSQQQEVSWPAADTIVWLDLSLVTVLRRCAKRTWRRWRTQELLYGGSNRENFWEHLMLWDTDKSLIAYTAIHHRRRRRDHEAVIREGRWPHLTFIRLRSTDEVQRWLDSIPAQAGHGSPMPAFVAVDGVGDA